MRRGLRSSVLWLLSLRRDVPAVPARTAKQRPGGSFASIATPGGLNGARLVAPAAHRPGSKT
jgi:hypothetical protein